MQRAVLVAAGGLLILAALLPFTSLGVWSVVPTSVAIGGAIFLVWLALGLRDGDRQPPDPAASAEQVETGRMSLKLRR